MPQRRIKGLAGKPSVYHCMSRTVNGEHLFQTADKDAFHKQLREAAEFSGVQILTFAILSNHFHVLVSVPDQQEAESSVTTEELIRRYRTLYPRPTKFRPAQVVVLEEILRSGGERGARLRRSLLDRMHDVSEFMKTLKQRFSIWFNGAHDRFGTLWADRFRSTLIEECRREALLTVAAYIDLNPVRASLVSDPKDYRWSGYGAAAAGHWRARVGLMLARDGLGEVLDEVSAASRWATIAAEYRLLLYAKGSAPKPHAGSVTPEQFAEVARRKGRIAVSELLRSRVRAITQGAVLGSRRFVMQQLTRYRRSTGRRLRNAPQALVEFGGVLLMAMRGVKFAH